MKIVAISDTHGVHKDLILPEGDMIIHAGDVSKRGTVSQVEDFLAWYAGLPFKYKIFIAGNHDFFFERATDEAISALVPDGVIYLNDSGISIEGIHIWGSPIQPWFHDWAFNRARGSVIRKHWELIPSHTDILITHGPVAHILDRTSMGEHVGCEDLRMKVDELKPKYHICGHIHEAYGVVVKEQTTFINASVMDLAYKLVHVPIVFDFA